jgi:YqaJ-like viral recombinase domain
MEIKRYIFESKDEWVDVRKDLFTASRISEIMPNGRVLMTPEELTEYKKTNPKSQARYREDETVLGDGAISYILEIIQGMEGAPKPHYYSDSMEHGTIEEPNAVLRYCKDYGYDLEADDVIYTSFGGTVFFVGDDLLGCTPDLILANKIVQIKCPDSSTHLKYKLFLNEGNFREREEKYFYQMQLEMMLTERKQGDFYSFDPRFKREKLQSHKVEVPADISVQNAIFKKAKLCRSKMNEFINQLK